MFDWNVVRHKIINNWNFEFQSLKREKKILKVKNFNRKASHRKMYLKHKILTHAKISPFDLGTSLSNMQNVCRVLWFMLIIVNFGTETRPKMGDC